MNLETTWEESDIRTPLIGLLSMGSDPTSAIEGLAKRKEVGMNYALAIVSIKQQLLYQLNSIRLHICAITWNKPNTMKTETCLQETR